MNGSEGNVKAAHEGEGNRRCVYCGVEAQIVWVHGHGQCSSCGINIEECCRGEQCTWDKG